MALWKFGQKIAGASDDRPSPICGTASAGREIAECRAALQERDLRYRTLLYNLPEKVVHKDRDSVYLSCNKDFAADFGMTPEQMVGKTDYDLYPQDRELADKYRADDRRIMASGETEEIEERYSTPTRQESIVHTVKAAVRDEHGNVTGILGIFSDITARKQAEEALRESEERYRKLAESTTDMIYIMDRAGSILYANASAAATTGFDVNSIVGRRQEEFLPPEIGRNLTENITKVFETGEVFKADGVYHFGSEEIWLNTRLMPLRDEKGQITSVMGVSRNITDRKQTEQALRQAHDELEQQVAETRLNEARLEAVLQLSHMTEASLKEITDFALEQAVALTRSKIGYLAFMNEDETVLTMHSWSKEAMAECAISDKPLVYPSGNDGPVGGGCSATETHHYQRLPRSQPFEERDSRGPRSGYAAT